jgi:DNA-binding CsgD family transcriptional regulator
MATGSPVRVRAKELIGRGRERELLDRLLAEVRVGESRALVICGEPGIGKSTLLEYVAERAVGFRVARAAGVQSEMELAFAGLHQLLAPMLDRLDGLPPPQRDALTTAFGTSAGPAPDRFFVGLAVLSLLADAAEEKPLICLVDDEQWLDRASAQVLAFVARRLGAESVGLVFTTRTPGDLLEGLPEVVVEGLSERDGRALLDSLLTAPLDSRVRDQIVAETCGNPLALTELSRERTPAQLAGGFGLVAGTPLSTSIEDSFRRRLEALPADTVRLLQLAAADPVGDPLPVWRAAEELGIPVDAAEPAAEAGLATFGPRVRFRHPLVRSAAYRSASADERHAVHRALAEVTDPAIDPDRRAWHLAQAARGPDSDVADELEASAGRALARGGLAAAAAFLERSATLTPDPARRGDRLLAAARAKRDAGALDEALGLLVAVETGAGPPDPLRTAEVEHLRGQIALEQQRGSDAARLFGDAARRFERLDPVFAREVHLEALVAAIWAGDLDNASGMLDAAAAARAASLTESSRVGDVMLDAISTRLIQGYAAAAPLLVKARDLVVVPERSSDEVERGLWLAGSRPSALVAVELWDLDAWRLIGSRQAQAARDRGALVQLRLALNLAGAAHLFAGDVSAAAATIEEDRLIAQATGNAPIPYTEMLLAAWRGDDTRASELIDATSRQASEHGLGKFVTLATYASSVLDNGLGRHGAAREAARRAFERDELGMGPFVLPELIDAAARTRDVELLTAASEWLAERTAATPNDWLLGVEARAHALLASGEEAEGRYRESIERLSRTTARLELARAHLVFGEWLRRERRRVDAREQLRTAHEMLTGMGAEAFAERAKRELLATGTTVRKRTVETGSQLTAQEAQIARLARDGLSNPEIAIRLFISRRTVQYHLHKVFTKLGIHSREQLDRVLPGT